MVAETLISNTMNPEGWDGEGGGGGSRWGDTCGPEADSCQWMAKTITIGKVIILQLKINKKS